MLTTFLKHFNIIDKQLDEIVQSDKFLPYNEKVNKVAHGHYPISPWVRHHAEQLKYLGEVRNLLIHHQGESHDYVQLTQEAVEDVEKFACFVTEPPTVSEYMSTPLVSCGPDDRLREVIQQYHGRYGHIPVIDDGQVIGGLSSDHVLSRCAEQVMVDMYSLRIRDIPLIKPHHYHLVTPDTSILDAVHLLAERGDYHAILVGSPGSIQGIITRHDVPKIVEKIL